VNQSCDCCAVSAPEPVSNAPAQTSLTYRIGTYGTFREAMLTQISRGALASLLTRESDDYAITVFELFAAIADVITFYQERYVQELFLRTATRPESLARLAAMLDYQLRPGIAARAELAFMVAAGKRTQVPARLRVKSVAATGQKPQTYETLHPLTVDAALNRLRIYPEPQSENPLAAGSMGGYLAPGPSAEAAASHLKPGDHLLLFNPGGDSIEDLEVDQLTVEEDRFLITWKRAVQGQNWDLDTRVIKAPRVFHVFGYNAPAQFMQVSAIAAGSGGVANTPGSKGMGTFATTKKFTTTTTTTGAPAPSSSLEWNLVTNDDKYPDPTQPLEGLALLCLDATYKGLEAGFDIVVWTGDKARVASVVAVDQVKDSYGGMTGPITRLTLKAVLPATFYRSKAIVYELVGPSIEFWGYRYPEALTGAAVLVPVRRIDAATVEVGRTVVHNKYQPGTRLNLDLLGGGRSVLLEDAFGHPVHATVTAATAAPAVVGPTADDSVTAAAIGLDVRSSRPVTTLVSRPLDTVNLRELSPSLMVTIGGVGPKHVSLQSVHDVPTAAGMLQQAINAADQAPAFKGARVAALDGNRLVIVPGGTGESVAFVDNGVTAEDLGLDPANAFYAGGLLSASFSTLSTMAGNAAVSVTLTGIGPRRATLASGAAYFELQNAIRKADPAPAFKNAQVIVLSTSKDPTKTVLNLLLLPGPVGPGRQDFLRLDLSPASPLALQSHSAVLLGNVAEASHGETVRGEVIGSGDASARFQSFSLKKKPLTYVPGSSDSGARSTLELLVNGVRWDEVHSLFREPPAAQVYTARLGEDGSTVIQFGDGTSGSVLPTGRNNLVATYRVGSGLAGRVGENSLTALLDRPTGLSSVTNPATAEGGGDPESPASVRRNAPRSVRTFGRAISLRDFEDLVMASGEVAKAAAAWTWDGFNRIIHVTVAGQAAGTFPPDDLRRLANNLASARDRNHTLRLDNFLRVPIVVQAVIFVEAARLHEDVTAAARQALVDALSFDSLSLGKTVHLSDIYRILQAVTGVSHVEVQQLRFKQPAGMNGQDFNAYLTDRGARLLLSGDQDPLQPRLRVLGARPDLAHPGEIVAAELAVLDAPEDLEVNGVGGITF
jgi:uncharacterized phage protein gp47/JayE